MSTPSILIVPVGDGVKRVLLGRALRSDHVVRSALTKRRAMAMFASDALSSNAYATQEILLVLSLGGFALLAYGPWIGAAVIMVFFIVALAYRQNVRAYPDGGGDYEVVRRNLGPRWGLIVASALLFDYVLTVAVAVSAAIANIGSIFPAVNAHTGIWAAVAIAGLALFNLRGRAQAIFVLPTYFFIGAIALLIVTGVVRAVLGQTMRAESADWEVVATDTSTGFALAFLIARAFASGTTALTGIQVVANNVPSFQEPKARNAATTLGLLAVVSMTMFAGITWLAFITNVRVANSNADLIGLPAGETQKTVIIQVAAAVFQDWSWLVPVVAAAVVLVLLLAANTAYVGFPLLASALGKEGYLPKQLHTRGDRLVYSNGIIVVTTLSIVAVLMAQANVTTLIQLYIVGVFIAFSLSQWAMVRHWTRQLSDPSNVHVRRQVIRSRYINGIGFLASAAVLVIVLVSKFTRGAWILVLGIPLVALVMLLVHRHYERVAKELAAAESEHAALPTRVHALVLVSAMHKSTLRALSYARATRPTVLEAITVQIDVDDSRRLLREWENRQIPVTLKILDAPTRDVTRPVIDYVDTLRSDNPNDLVIVFLPEYVIGHWWEWLLHNQSVRRIKARLRMTPGVMVTSVPWRLRSRDHRA